MKVVLVSLLVGIFFQSYPSTFEGKVHNVIDGNTIEILTKEGEIVKIMLKDVDCPEIGQDFGEKAKNFTEDMILKKKVVVDVKGKDRWGNKLGIISLKNGKKLHEELLKEGLAWTYKSQDQNMLSLENTAKNAKQGLWSAEDPTPPWIFKRQQTMLQPKSNL